MSDQEQTPQVPNPFPEEQPPIIAEQSKEIVPVVEETLAPAGGEAPIPLNQFGTDPEEDVLDELYKETPNEKPLTSKQAMFVLEYLKDMNGTQAAIRAGYSIDTAGIIASQNLKKLNISKAIKLQMDYRAKRTLISADYVLSRMKDVAERCLQAEPVMYFDKESGEWKQETTAEGNPVYQFDSGGANKALENLARNQKLLTDKTELGNADGSNLEPIVIQEISVESIAAAAELLEKARTKTDGN